LKRLSLTLSIAALTIAVLGSTQVGHAARELVLPRASVGAAQLKPNAITSAKVMDGTLVAADFKAGALQGGPAGSPGTEGPVGATGSAGPAGPAGTAGATGLTGPAGSAGPAGLAGPSGIVKALSFEANWSGTKLPGNSGKTRITPGGCRTEAHVASAGESAFVSMNAMGSPSVAATDVIYIFAMSSVNGGAFAPLTKLDSVESVSDGSANVSVVGVYPLEAGKTYVFAAAFASNSPVTVNPGYCRGAVLIIKTS
jgi:hypothetical protein